MSAHEHDRPILALLIRLVGIAGLASMAALIKLASSRGIHLVELLFWRQFLALPILIGWALMNGGIKRLGTQRPRAQIMRGVSGTIGMIFNFGAVILLPLAEATTFGFSAPIFAVLLSIVLLREQVGIWRWSAVLAGFLGILVIVQPGNSGHAIPMFGAAVALAGAFMIALISIQIRDLSRTENPMAIVFWFAATSSLLLVLALPFVATNKNTGDWLLLLAIGLTGTLGQIGITTALRFGQVASVIVMDYSSIVWATLFGWLLFATLPTTSTWMGAPLVILAGLIIGWRERVLHKQFTDQRAVSGGT